VVVHLERASLDFPMPSAPSTTGNHGLSWFGHEMCPTMHGVSDRSAGLASRSGFVSRLKGPRVTRSRCGSPAHTIRLSHSQHLAGLIRRAEDTSMTHSAEGALAASRIIEDQIVPGGGYWSRILVRGQTLRIVDLEGCQAVDFICYNARDTTDRYSATMAGTTLFAGPATADRIE
jgi:Domain of unknown function (DUF1989)